VNENHPYAGCRGTPDQYTADDWWDHTFNDSGGIWEAGGPAAKESIRKKADDLSNAIEDWWSSW